MSEQDNLQSVARKLDDLDAKLNDAVAAGRRRNKVGLITSIIIIILLSIYLGVAYEKFGSVDPVFAAALTQSTLEGYLPEVSAQLEQKLKDNAPNVIDRIEKQVRAMPDQFASRLGEESQKHMEEKMPALEDAMYKSLKTSLAQAKDEVGKTPGKSDEDRFKSLLQSLADVYGNEGMKAIDEFHATYASGAADMIAHLNLLAENKNLEKEQQLQRDIVHKFLVLSQHYNAESGSVDQTKTSFGGKDAAITGTK